MARRGPRIRLPRLRKRPRAAGERRAEPPPAAERPPAVSEPAASEQPGPTEQPTQTSAKTGPAVPKKRRLPRLPRPPKPRRPRLRRPGFLAGRGRQIALLGGGAFAGALVALAVVSLVGDDDSGDAPAPTILVREDEPDVPEASEELGFPGFATRNTTRVAGADATADAAGAALAAFPTGGGVEGPAAISLVGAEDWPSALAASSLAAEPVRAPILLSDDDEVPDFTTDAVEALAPRGGPDSGGDEAFAFGEVSVPDGLRFRPVVGANPAQVAAATARVRRNLARPPEAILLVSTDDPAYAMPAGAWSAFSGDPILFVGRNSVPQPTLRELRRNEGVPVFLLGPRSVASANVVEALEQRADVDVTRIAGEDPVSNATEFARFASGSFGWNINDPGHGMVIANVDRPLDVAAAASLSPSGKPGPLLLTDDALSVPPELRAFLLDTKPGFSDDATRAVYNHVWLLGDTSAIGLAFQVQVDELANLVPVEPGTQGPRLGPPPGQPEAEPAPPDRPR